MSVRRESAIIASRLDSTALFAVPGPDKAVFLAHGVRRPEQNFEAALRVEIEIVFRVQRLSSQPDPQRVLAVLPEESSPIGGELLYRSGPTLETIYDNDLEDAEYAIEVSYEGSYDLDESVLADGSKLVDVLGKFPLPVEVIPMASAYVARELTRLGGTPVLREGFVTDNGNLILDVKGLQILDPVDLETRINQIVGVVTNGLFACRRADVCLLGTPTGVQTHTAD